LRCFQRRRAGRTERCRPDGIRCAGAPTTPTSRRFKSSSLQRIEPEPTPTQLMALTGPSLKTSRARAAVRSPKSDALVSRTTLRTRTRGAMGFRVTMTTWRQSVMASSSATVAPPTYPIPPRMIATKLWVMSREPGFHPCRKKRGEMGAPDVYVALRSFSTAIAALRPLMPMTLPPGWVHAPQRYMPFIGVRAERRLSHM
jgi:hypothetical protein